MHEFSAVDGFIEVKEGVDEMIKYLANEPSVGLFFVQQHAQASMPYLLGVKDKVVERIHEVTLHTEDVEDSIEVVRSMSECGLPIVDEMIKDINRSLLVMSTSRPKKGVIQRSSCRFQTDRSSSSSSTALNNNAIRGEQDSKSGHNFLSAVVNSARQKAVAGFRWSQPNNTAAEAAAPKTLLNCDPEATHCDAKHLPPANVDTDELPLSSHLVDDDQQDEPEAVSRKLSDSYDEFRIERESKLEEWLQEPEVP